MSWYATMSNLIPFKGTTHITEDPNVALRCVHCKLFDPDARTIITIEPLRNDCETIHDVPDGPTLSTCSTIHVLHLKCYVSYHVTTEMKLLSKIDLPPHDHATKEDVPERLMTHHEYLRHVGVLYDDVPNIKFYCVSMHTSPHNPSYRFKVPSLPVATPIYDKKLWSSRMYQHLFSIMHLVDVEVTLRNHNHTTNFATLFNQVLTFFGGFTTQLQGVYVWWHEVKQTSRDRSLFRIVILNRPPLVDTESFVQRVDTTWSDFVGEQLAISTSVGHLVQDLHRNAHDLMKVVTTALVTHFSESEDYNVKLADTPVAVPFTTVASITSTDIGCVFNAQHDPNKNRVRCFVVETKPHPTIVPYQAGQAYWLPISFESMKEFVYEHSSLEDPLHLLPTDTIVRLS